MTAKIESAMLPNAQAPALEARRSLAFECKCGCDLFRVDVDIFADHTWGAVILCAACGKSCVPSEPLLNGPH